MVNFDLIFFCVYLLFYTTGRQSYALVSHKRPENGLYAKWTRCTNLAADVPPYSSIQELNFKPIESLFFNCMLYRLLVAY